MRILLVAEGSNELGSKSEFENERPGALKILIGRMGLSDAEIKIDRANRSDLRTHPGKGKGFFKRALRWMKEAEKEGFDALILVIDQDKRPTSVNEFNDAQASAEFSVSRALGVAIRTFDAWMLADEVALTKVLGEQVNRQSDPESIPNPKQLCDRLLHTSNASMNRSEMYAAIAREIDLSALQSRCPKGFAPFAERVMAICS